MSIVLTRSPLEPIGMNEGSVHKRRSARLSQDGDGENEPPAKKTKINGASTTTVTTKQQDGESKSAGKRKRKVYDEEVEGFTFSKGRRGKGKQAKEPVVRNPIDEQTASGSTQTPSSDAPAAFPPAAAAATKPSSDDTVSTKAQKKLRRRLPTTPEREVVEKPTRRSKRLSNEKELEKEVQQSPQGHYHAKSHANNAQERSPSPEKARPVTVEKKRKQGANGVEEEKVMTIALPFADTPVIRRNKEMRKNSAEGHRRSSTGMRGKRASSLIDEGRGHEASEGSTHSQQAAETGDKDSPIDRDPHAAISGAPTSLANADSVSQDSFADDESVNVALPHAEVPTSEFFKHISADLTEPRRMRCLLGWCGTRSLPLKLEPPRDATSVETQALQAARSIQEELSQDLITRGTLSDWFSRDESAPPPIPLQKKPNPRNVANSAKAEELERELERLKRDRAEWDQIIQSVPLDKLRPEQSGPPPEELSPLRTEVLDMPQRAIFEQLRDPASKESTDPSALQQRLQAISKNLEFAIDQFSYGVHALTATRETAERVAARSLSEAAETLEERDKQRAASGDAVDQMDALRGLARVLNSQMR